MSNVNRAIELGNNLVEHWQARPRQRVIASASVTHTLPSRYPNNGLRKSGVTITSADRRVSTDIVYFDPREEEEGPEQGRILQITQERYTGPYSGKREVIFFDTEIAEAAVDTVQQEIFLGFNSLRPLYIYQRALTSSPDESARMSAIINAPKDALHFQLLYTPSDLSLVTFNDRLGRSDYSLVQGENGPELEFGIWPESTSRLETASRLRHPDKYKEWVGKGMDRQGERIPLRGEVVSIRGGQVATTIDPELVIANILEHSRIEKVLAGMNRGD